MIKKKVNSLREHNGLYYLKILSCPSIKCFLNCHRAARRPIRQHLIIMRIGGQPKPKPVYVVYGWYNLYAWNVLTYLWE